MSILPIATHLWCVFCDIKKVDHLNRKLDFISHPFVTKTFSGNEIYLCIPCVTNWSDYRCRMESENGLILPGEQNEELCAICSDTPDELVLCSTCVRSYCNPCLKRSCNSDDLAFLDSDAGMFSLTFLTFKTLNSLYCRCLVSFRVAH